MVMESPGLYINIPVLYKNGVIRFFSTKVHTLTFVPVAIRKVYSKLPTEK